MLIMQLDQLLCAGDSGRSVELAAIDPPSACSPDTLWVGDGLSVIGGSERDAGGLAGGSHWLFA